MEKRPPTIKKGPANNQMKNIKYPINLSSWMHVFNSVFVWPRKLLDKFKVFREDQGKVLSYLTGLEFHFFLRNYEFSLI